MTQQKPRIIWMMEETFANTKPSDWTKVRALEEELVHLVGNNDFHHEIIDPLQCLPETVRQLRGKDFSSIIDLTGWMTPALSELFPKTPIENGFTLSRVRVVSSPSLETTGYMVSIPPQELERKKQEFDLSHPLIMDDVSFTGWTSRKTMELWGIAPETVTHSFLIGNTGMLGEKPGAVKMLRSLGCKTAFGFPIQTPQDDGWHMKDLQDHPNLESALRLALSFQEKVRQAKDGEGLAKRFFSDQRVIEVLFPQFLSSDQIRQMHTDGKFIMLNGGVVDANETHAKNPFLWSSPYFVNHIDVPKTVQNINRVISVLTELQRLSSDPEGRQEATQGLRLEAQKAVSLHAREGNGIRGERMI